VEAARLFVEATLTLGAPAPAAKIQAREIEDGISAGDAEPQARFAAARHGVRPRRGTTAAGMRACSPSPD
jgi:hypothetical protein